jgi:hypothetical protein
MNGTLRNRLLAAALVPSVFLLASCGIDVHEEEHGDKKRVDIRTPLGEMTVNTNIDAPATGLPNYPGARPLDEGDEPRSANVNIGSSMFGLTVVAAKFESADAPQKLVEFYRKEMGAYGAVTECRGDIDFRGRAGAKRAVCRARASREIQLVAGSEERHRRVSIKPRRGGSELALVYIETRGEG